MSDPVTAAQSSPTSVSTEAPKYLVETILPVRRCHLIVGPSGAGKTRWMLPMMEDFISGKSIMDRKTNTLPCGYLVCDRPAEAAQETIAMLDLPGLATMPIKSLMNMSAEFTPDILPTMFDKSVKVIFIEALAALVPNGKINDYASVLRFFRMLYRIMDKHDLTIIGTVHQPKLREDESFTHPRDKVLGSVAWAACSDLVVLIEPENAKNIHSTRRKMTVLPRNESHFEYKLDYDAKGRLVPNNSEAMEADFMFDQELAKLPVSSPILTAVFMDWGDRFKLSARTVDRWISNRCDEGKLEKVKKGTYRRPHSN